MKIKVRSFNEEGNLKFKKFVIEMKKEFKSKKTKNFKVPLHLIKDKKLTSEVKNSKEIDLNKKFINSYDYAVYINERISNIDLKKYRWDRGLFNWISAAYFTAFFPGIRSGSDEKNRYLSEEKGKWRRQLARTLWEIYHVYKEDSLCLLYKPTNNYSDELETISKSPIMFSSKGVVEAYSQLYFKKKSHTTGEQSYKRGEVGDFRDFIEELYQIELNLDIYRMSKDQILNKLNEKFSKKY
tara:strand:- start:108 stop:827 length:720 start_codon:yes stop_codon:yes gene_type:complete